MKPGLIAQNQDLMFKSRLSRKYPHYFAMIDSRAFISKRRIGKYVQVKTRHR